MEDTLWTLEKVLHHLEKKQLKLFNPYYQRGYRWKSLEIEQLLNDVDSNEKGNYFLQLLAVRQDDNNHHLRIIDGQQRLTTVLLILGALDGKDYCTDMIKYETRNHSSTESNYTLDGYFQNEASQTIIQWLANKSDEQKTVFARKLKECEFLYFPIEEENSEFDFFSRLNTWKISATDSELVKCYFLSDDNLEAIEKRAVLWNQMERQLSNNQFWGMFANSDVVNADRMGVLLSYVNIGKIIIKKEEKYPLFESYREAGKTNTKGQLWSKVEKAFNLLLQWYGNRYYRHLVGWYVHRKGSIFTLMIEETIIKDAHDKAAELLGDGKWLEDPELFNNGNKDNIHNYLLLANMSWCAEKLGVDYDFYRHTQITRWSIEHIHARNQRKLDEMEFKNLKFKDKEGDISDLWKQYCEECEKKDNSIANDFLQKHLLDDSYPEIDEDNSIGNLSLLPSDTNSSLNNKLFIGKQSEILSWALRGDKAYYWAPPLTIAMFTKEIGEPNHKFHKYWSKPDREAYRKMLASLIKAFLEKCN